VYPWTGDRPHDHAPPGWLTIDQAAGYFGVSRATIDRLIASGEWQTSILPGMRHRRFSPADIAAIELAATPAVSA
jgi:excisionase family DNA binding protein